MNANDITEEQRAVCIRVGAGYHVCDLTLKVGISQNFDPSHYPLNGFRHPLEGDTTGWYIWSGENFSDHADFFVPIHAAHLLTRAPILIKYLGLEPGWRFLVAPGHEDMWFDKTILMI